MLLPASGLIVFLSSVVTVLGTLGTGYGPPFREGEEGAMELSDKTRTDATD